MTVTETFTSSGQTQRAAVQISPAARTLQLFARWRDPASSFDITNVEVVLRVAGRRPAVVTKLRIQKLRITKTRTSRSVEVRAAKPKPGLLRFTVKAKRVNGPTTVKTTVRQSRKRL